MDDASQARADQFGVTHRSSTLGRRNSWDLERHIVGSGEVAANCEQGAARVAIHRGRKFDKLLALVVNSSDKDWNGKA